MALGPDKAPGPDGMNARFLQTYWQELKPSIETEIKKFFQIGHMPPYIAKSNMILIPKIENPTQVTDYRPISICNVSYKIISKIIATRMKPIIQSLIHHNQAAFTKGRQITDHIILMREIIHTFSMPSFNKSAFCLKSDLLKAFDRMSWSFIEKILSMYAFPPTLITWIMACIKSTHFSILFEGSGDGFITPTRGIRQGCALSPYIFILCMNVLSAIMQHELQHGRLQGL